MYKPGGFYRRVLTYHILPDRQPPGVAAAVAEGGISSKKVDNIRIMVYNEPYKTAPTARGAGGKERVFL